MLDDWQSSICESGKSLLYAHYIVILTSVRIISRPLQKSLNSYSVLIFQKYCEMSRLYCCIKQV